jgi:hypothetical protein
MGFFQFVLSFLPFVSRRRYDDVLRLNQQIKEELETWIREEKKRARRNRFLHLHNAMLRDLLLRKQMMEDTNGMVESFQAMIINMQAVVEEAESQER